MSKKFKVIIILLLTCIISLALIWKNLILYANLTFDLIKINNTLPTVSCNFYDNPIEDISHKDIVYKKRGDLELKLDIYSPTKPTSKGSPVILYVFGNGWTDGTKTIPSAISPIIDTLRDSGYTIISTSYELMDSEVIFKNQVSDIKDTIRWIYKNQDKYNFNVNDIGIISPSAGAQLSMLAAYSDNNSFIDDKELSKYPSNVKYIIDLFGPARLSELNLSAGPKEIVDKISESDIVKLSSQYSPINYIKSNLPDTLIIHSKADKIVPYDSSVELFEEAKKYNNNFEFFTLEDSTHYLENMSEKESLSLYLKIINYIISKTQ